MMQWFKALEAPKVLEQNGELFHCWIGFNRRVKTGNVIHVVGDEVIGEGETREKAIEDARSQYEFLTM